ncbi:MAG: hypothetical protein EZS28_048968 [Streblomastix strix]|uniref:Uncharacterized protein n=1 Tax=Streblomastix strix TaxID=222440 RepID=A0A5J4TDG1_9EUKA|nr:MAG: hypothetical protein EZS28_048968 [Streblomastix strix]
MQQNKLLEKQRLEEFQKQNAQRRRREEEARENFENLRQFVQRKDFDNLQQQRELQEYKDEHQRRMFAEDARKNFENLRQFVQERLDYLMRRLQKKFVNQITKISEKLVLRMLMR